MVAVRGSSLLVKRGNAASPEVFTAVGSVQSSTLTINGNPIDITTGDDVDVNDEIWQTFMTGPKGMTVAANGIAKSFTPIQTIYNDYVVGTLSNYQIVVPNLGTWTVSMAVTNMEFNGPYDGVTSFSMTLQGAAAPTFVAES